MYHCVGEMGRVFFQCVFSFMPCSLLDVKVFDVSVLVLLHGFISCARVRVCMCDCVAQIYHMGVGFFFIKFFYLLCFFKGVPVTGK